MNPEKSEKHKEPTESLASGRDKKKEAIDVLLENVDRELLLQLLDSLMIEQKSNLKSER